MWSADRGQCPNSTCPVGDVCDVRLSGEYYCQCVTDCADSETTGTFNYELLALLVIPFVVIVVLLIVLIVIVLRRRRNDVENKVRHLSAHKLTKKKQERWLSPTKRASVAKNKILLIYHVIAGVRRRIRGINTNNNIMTLKSGLEVTQCH